MHLPTAQKSRSERNCSGFFLCRGIIKRCTPLGSKCTPHRPFVKWYRGVKRNRLRGDHFRTTVEPVIVKRYRKTLVNRGFYKKKLDTRFDTHCIKTGVQLWCGRQDLNLHAEAIEPKSIVSASFTTSAGNVFSIPRFSGFVKHVHQFFPKRHPQGKQANQTNGQKANEITCISPCLLQLQPPDKQEQNQTNSL